MKHNSIYNEDCLATMGRMDPASVDLVITSPPYAGKRSDQYQSPTVDGYIEWFMPVSDQIRRVLRPSGSFILNIKEGAKDGIRQRYVYDMVITMQDAGWRWVDEFVWVKTNPYPGKVPGRLKDGWERVYHFTKLPGHKFNHDAVRRPLTPGTAKRLSMPSASKQRDVDVAPGSGSGLSVNYSKTYSATSAIPPNVLTMRTTQDHDHPAAYPMKLPEFFIKLLTDPGDLVYDPFMGSGTTAYAAASLGRRWIGSEISAEYCELIKRRLAGRVYG